MDETAASSEAEERTASRAQAKRARAQTAAAASPSRAATATPNPFAAIALDDNEETPRATPVRASSLAALVMKPAAVPPSPAKQRSAKKKPVESTGAPPRGPSALGQ